MKTDKNHSAFPLPKGRTLDDEGKSGLTKLEYFTGVAIQLTKLNHSPEEAAIYAVNFAKAVIAELNKQ